MRPFFRGTARERFQLVFTRVFEPGYRPRAISVGFHMDFEFSGQMRFRSVAIAICVDLRSGGWGNAISIDGQSASGVRFPRMAKRLAISEDFSRLKTLGRQSVFRFSEDGPKARIARGKRFFRSKSDFSVGQCAFRASRSPKTFQTSVAKA